MRRHRDWRARMAAAIEVVRRLAHRLGAHDCALFCADVVLAMTGVDLAARYRGRYASVDEAMEVMRADGFDDLCALVASMLEEIPPALARMGDVMAFPSEETGWALGICNGEQVTVLRADGLGSVSREKATRAFRVP